MIKSLKSSYTIEDGSFIDYGISVGFRSFKVMKLLKLDFVVNNKIYYKIVSKFYLFQTLLGLVCYLVLFLLNCSDTGKFLSMEI